ncbi:MAG: PaaI family thioesterase [Xanthobacteraceae bacterium]|nr:MAG: PaaI family thioesterase [Xanthobacteraceae bacterium]
MTGPRMNVDELDRFLRCEFAESFNDAAGYAIEAADGASCRVRQRYRPDMLRPGGTISGPTLMAMADVAMYVVILSAIGPVGLAVTTNLSINFLRKAPAGHDVIAEARLLKLGKRLAVGEVALLSAASPDLVAHVTSTYSIPPQGDS